MRVKKLKKKSLTQQYIDSHIKNFKLLNFEEIENLINTIKNTCKIGGVIYTCGNGGSAYNASHFVTDWNKFIPIKLKNFKSISLCDNLGLITATSNDSSYDNVFLEQLKNFYNKKDLLICISGSGNSKNLIKATKYARSKNGKVFSLVGFDGGQLKKISNYSVHVRSNDMQICEDTHIMIGHIVMKFLSNINVK